MKATLNKLIDGKAIAADLLDKLSIEYKSAHYTQIPTLAVVLVGNVPASQIYVQKKIDACKKFGINSVAKRLREDITEKELLAVIDRLNKDDSVHGILVQLPLPKHLNSKLIIDNIEPNKDVDGFHRYNAGSLFLNNSLVSPCTPSGVMYLLDALNVSYPGKHAVVIGSSNIVGRPMALELLNRGATVTICNSKTQNLKELTNMADILVVAIGKPNFITKDYVKQGAIVIDVGINRLEDGKIYGDVAIDDVLEKVSHITPVPGGVGPMTIAMLIANTLKCYKLRGASCSV